MAPLWCDLERCSQTAVVIKLRRTSVLYTETCSLYIMGQLRWEIVRSQFCADFLLCVQGSIQVPDVGGCWDPRPKTSFQDPWAGFFKICDTYVTHFLICDEIFSTSSQWQAGGKACRPRSATDVQALEAFQYPAIQTSKSGPDLTYTTSLHDLCHLLLPLAPSRWGAHYKINDARDKELNEAENRKFNK